MLTNYHTHSTFCDGVDTPEEMVLGALELGFDALGFSGHGFTSIDSSYCIKDHDAYIAEIRRLQKKYAKQIQIYVGLEEDMRHPCRRSDFDYIIGSSHYVCKDGVYYPVDSGEEGFETCLSLYDDPISLARAYFEPFVSYILDRKPDIVGHFDLITKYDEKHENMYLEDREYLNMAREYMTRALESQCIFEVNTGAIARGTRTRPYPCLELLYLMKQHNAKLILSSDCHDRRLLSCYFEESRNILRDVGFETLYILYDGKFREIKV